MDPSVRFLPPESVSRAKLGLKGGTKLPIRPPEVMDRAEWLKKLMEPLPGEGLLEGGTVLAERETPGPAREPGRRRLGFLHGSVLYMAPDFDAPLDEFEAGDE